MRKHIDLSEAKLKSIKPEEIIAITLASGGAMGDPNAIELVDKDLKVYYTHFGKIANSKLKKVIPFMDTVRVEFDNISGTGDDWVGMYTGYGNCLFVRPELKEPITNYVKKNYGDTDMPFVVELYTHWFDALNEEVEADKLAKARLKKYKQIWNDFFDNLTADMSQKCKDFVKTKEGRCKYMDWYFDSDHDEYPWAFFTEENMK